MWDRCWGSSGRSDDFFWGGGGIFLALLGLIALALLAGVIFVVTRANGLNESPRYAGSGSVGADELLAERFARGEIDEQEYLLRKQVLAESRNR